MSPKHAALAYLKAGLPICLCNGGDGDEGKKPFGTTGPRDWQHNSDWTPDLVDAAFTHRQKIGAPEPNAGIRLGPIMSDGGGFIDVEFDGPTGEVELDMLDIDLGDPIAWESARGRHHLYRLTAEEFAKCEKVTRTGVLKQGELEVRLGNKTGSLQSVLPNDSNGRKWVGDPPADQSNVPSLPPGVLAKFLAALSTQNPVAEANSSDRFDKKPGDYFNERADWNELLTGAGWRHAGSDFGVDYWTRPGKAGGVSATVGYCSTDLRGELFYSFSDSPEIAPLEAHRSYSKFEFFAAVSHGDTSDESLFAATKDVAELYEETRRNAGDLRVSENYDPADFVTDGIEDETDDDLGPTLDLPLDLIKFPGFVSDFAEWHSRRCGMDYEYAGAVYGILMQSWLMGRRTQLEGTCPNANLLLFGPSGSGKTRGAKSIKDLLVDLGRTGHIVESFASGESIEDELADNPHLLLIHEEVNQLFQGIGDTRRPHLASFHRTFNQVATAADSFLGVRKKASNKRKGNDNNLGPVIAQPHLSAVFTGVERNAWDSLPNTAGEDGFLARLMPFTIEVPDHKFDRDEDEVLRGRLVRHAAEWLAVSPGTREPADAVDTITPLELNFYEITRTSDAAALHAEMSERGWRIQQRSKKDPITGSTWARDAQMATTLQLIMAGSATAGTHAQVTEDMVRKSFEITARMFAYKIAWIKTKLIAETEQERLVSDRVEFTMNYIKDRGIVRRRDVLDGPLRRFAQQSDLILSTLQRREQIVLVKAKIGDAARPTEFIVVAGKEIPEKFDGKSLTLVTS